FLIFTVVAILLLNSKMTQAQNEVANANFQIELAGETLTPIPPTLTAVAQTVVAGSYMIESLDLSADANSILRTEGGDAQTAALLSIRALQKIYLPSADAALLEAETRLNAIPFTIPSQGYMSRVAFSPDGLTFLIGISGNDAGSILQLWDSKTTLRIWSSNVNYLNINSVAFSPNGELIVIASSNQTAVIIDATNGKEIRVLSGYSDAVQSAIFTPDNKKILTSGSGSDLTLRLWDVETGKQIYSTLGTWGGSDLFFIMNGQVFSSSGHLYNTSDGSPNTDLNISGGALAISPDGDTYVDGFSSTPKIYDIGTGQVLRSFIGHTDIVKDAAFSSDGKLLVTSGEDNSSRVWEVATGKQLMLLSGKSNQVPSVAFSSDGTQILTGGNNIRLWNITPEDLQKTFSVSSAIMSAALSPDGKTILIGEESGNTGLWDLNSGKLIQKFSKDITFSKTVAFSPDGKLVAVSIGSQFEQNVVDINLYEASTGTLKKNISITSPHPMVFSLAFSADGSMLLATLEDNISRLFDVETGQLLRSINGENGTAIISPNGRLVSISNGPNWWDIGSESVVNYSVEMFGNEMVFSLDGSLIAIGKGDGTIDVWNFGDNKKIRHITGHTGQIMSMVFSADNKTLLSGSADNTARLWDVSTGQQLRVFSGHTAAVTNVGFISNGNKIVTTSMDKTVRIWFTDYNDLMDYVCTFLGSDLSTEERVIYGVSDQDATCPQFGAQSQSLVPTPTPMITLTPLPVWTPIATPTLGN
ncbi:MAG: hypothetical protein C0410_08855, partial [Anaerolinea sp.]|nr:hypothetical protein [Anaerolinea sp.]